MNATFRKNYLLGVLLLILAFNIVDGQVLGLVLQNIKDDLQVTDTQLGFLTGIAFAVFYSIVGVPIARWADRGNRVLIIGLTTAIWSAAVSLCGMAANFTQLLLIRIPVAVGESGCIPSAHSLIADYFGRASRPRAVGIYMLGAYLGVVIGNFGAGWLNELYGWRETFMLLGLPGLILSALAWFTLREPRLHPLEPGLPSAPTVAPSAASPAPSLREVFATLWSSKTFRHLLLGFSVVYFFGTGIGQWQPAFLIRSYGIKTGELGTWFALIYGIGGMAGTYFGGTWASRNAANNERLQLKAIAIAYSSFGVLSTFTYLAPNLYLTLALMGLSAMGIAMASGPLLATIQTLVPERMRALSIAMIYLFANLIGSGLGPLAVGALSDALRPVLGEESLRYALLALSPGYFWVGWHLWRASRCVMADLAALRTDDADSDDTEHVVANVSAR
jgi:MFS family permease